MTQGVTSTVHHTPVVASAPHTPVVSNVHHVAVVSTIHHDPAPPRLDPISSGANHVAPAIERRSGLARRREDSSVSAGRPG